MLYLLDTLVDSQLSLSSDSASLPHLLGHVLSVEEREGERKSRQKVLGSRYAGWTSGSRQHRTKKKLEQRAKVAILDSILSGILTHVVCLSPPPHIQSSLLAILAEVDSPVSTCCVYRTVNSVSYVPYSRKLSRIGEISRRKFHGLPIVTVGWALLRKKGKRR